jgi:hypothetical protein
MSKKLSGLHPWLRFKGHTQEQWVEWYGLDTEFIEVKAAEAYLEGEAIFFVIRRSLWRSSRSSSRQAAHTRKNAK